MKKLLTLALLVLAASPAHFASAQADDVGNKGSADPKSSLFQFVSCDGVDDPRTAEKEVECDYNQVIYTISRIIQFVLYILTPIVLGMILWMGFKYLTAGGDPGKLASAKKMFMPIAIGVLLIFTAYVLVYKVILQYLLDGSGGIDKSSIITPGSSR